MPCSVGNHQSLLGNQIAILFQSNLASPEFLSTMVLLLDIKDVILFYKVSCFMYTYAILQVYFVCMVLTALTDSLMTYGFDAV